MSRQSLRSDILNTFYTALSVLKNYIQKHGYEIINFSLQGQAPDRVVMWVAENENHVTHFVCIKMSCTQFLLWGYGNNYEEVLHTSFDYADVNTPDLETE